MRDFRPWGRVDIGRKLANMVMEEHSASNRTESLVAAPAAINQSRVLLVDPHPAVLEGLAAVISNDPNLEVGATATNAASARRIIEDAPFDIAVIARELPDGDGPQLCAEISKSLPNIRCIVHSAGEIASNDLAHCSVTAVVLKQLSGTDLIDTIRDLSSRPAVHRDRTPSQDSHRP